MVNVNKCFGNPDSKRYCARCRYLKSCRYYRTTEPRMESHLGLVNYGVLAEWNEDVADFDHIPGTEEEHESTEISARLGEFFRYLLELDDYTLSLIAELITPGDPEHHRETIAALARLRNTSRQALHRTLQHLISRRPELADFFRLVLRKIVRSRGGKRSPATT